MLKDILLPRRRMSEQRRGLHTAVMEGIPANIIGNLLGGPLLTAYLLYLGAKSDAIGIALAIPAFANLVQLIIAFYMHRFENRRLHILVFSMVHRTLWTATGLIPFWVPEAYWVSTYIAMFTISFICAQAGGVLWTSLVADMVPAQVRGRYFGIRNTIHWAVASLCLLIGGQILNRLPEGSGFVMLYVICAVATIWNGIELYRYPNLPLERSNESSKWKKLQKPLRDRTYLLATLFLATFIMIQNIAVPLFSFVMLDIVKLNYTWVTIITTIQMVVMMFSYYYWGNLNSKYATRTLLRWSLPIIAIACLLWSGMELLPAIFVLIVVHIVLGIGIGGYNLLAFNFIIGDTPKSERPMYIAVFSALTGITGFIGPLAGGWIYKRVEDSPYWLQSYGVSTITGALLLFMALVIGPIVLKEKKPESRRTSPKM
ncbi:MFS transporter [Paenibacillus sp. PL91]|uniref:MFS transporter n=1 Tax=Paenibacillus sp. PL91 TaxID=2729538 RepID=UPI00145CAF04|nr:MFS transporter [Paenibacillus sp. PL91]MBC9202427.1 MFS transporter [Paenibacillus sp. PL91]